eukprot:403349690
MGFYLNKEENYAIQWIRYYETIGSAASEGVITSIDSIISIQSLDKVFSVARGYSLRDNSGIYFVASYIRTDGTFDEGVKMFTVHQSTIDQLAIESNWDDDIQVTTIDAQKQFSITKMDPGFRSVNYTQYYTSAPGKYYQIRAIQRDPYSNYLFLGGRMRLTNPLPHGTTYILLARIDSGDINGLTYTKYFTLNNYNCIDTSIMDLAAKDSSSVYGCVSNEVQEVGSPQAIGYLAFDKDTNKKLMFIFFDNPSSPQYSMVQCGGISIGNDNAIYVYYQYQYVINQEKGFSYFKDSLNKQYTLLVGYHTTVSGKNIGVIFPVGDPTMQQYEYAKFQSSDSLKLLSSISGAVDLTISINQTQYTPENGFNINTGIDIMSKQIHYPDQPMQITSSLPNKSKVEYINKNITCYYGLQCQVEVLKVYIEYCDNSTRRFTILDVDYDWANIQSNYNRQWHLMPAYLNYTIQPKAEDYGNVFEYRVEVVPDSKGDKNSATSLGFYSYYITIIDICEKDDVKYIAPSITGPIHFVLGSSPILVSVPLFQSNYQECVQLIGIVEIVSSIEIIDFTLIVYESIVNYGNTPPFFIKKLVNQTMIAGQSLSYKLPTIMDNQEDNYTSKYILGIAQIFTIVQGNTMSFQQVMKSNMLLTTLLLEIQEQKQGQQIIKARCQYYLTQK